MARTGECKIHAESCGLHHANEEHHESLQPPRNRTLQGTFELLGVGKPTH